MSRPNTLEMFFHLDPLLFFHIFWIFLEMKACSPSSSNLSSDSSSKEFSTLKALDELLDVDFEDDSLDDDTFLVFWMLRARDFHFLSPSSF